MQIFCCLTKQNTNFAFVKQRKFHNLKWQCHEIVFPFSFESNAPDKYAKMVLVNNTVRLRGDIQILSLKNLTLRRLTLHGVKQSWSMLKQFTYFFIFSFKARRGLQRQKLCRQKKLRTVLVFAKSDSAHCQSIWDFQNICLTLRSVSLTLRSISQCRVRIRAVLACAESLISRISLRRRIYPQTILACLSGGKKMPNNLVTLPL